MFNGWDFRGRQCVKHFCCLRAKLISLSVPQIHRQGSVLPGLRLSWGRQEQGLPYQAQCKRCGFPASPINGLGRRQPCIYSVVTRTAQDKATCTAHASREAACWVIGGLLVGGRKMHRKSCVPVLSFLFFFFWCKTTQGSICLSSWACLCE